MEELVMYFMKSAGVLLLFLGLYFAVLRSETFFQENRFFMLGGMLISLLLPFVVITHYIDLPAVSQEMMGNFVYSTTEVPIETTSMSWIDVLIYTYLAGVIVFFGKFIIELFSLFRLLWKSGVSKRDGQFAYVETTTSYSPFSFFNYIVYNPELYSASELEAILKHEQAHSRQMHSVDVFVSKLYCIFFWFNPFAWMHKKFMLQNLEFLADSAAIKQTPSKKEYQLTLLKVSGNNFCPALTNNFYNSLIKKRIVMLQKTQSTQTNRWKQMLILPLLVAFVFLFNTKVVAKEIPATNYENTIVETSVGDLVAVITKSTTADELKAYQKLFKSQKIKFEYSQLEFNSKGEINKIFVVLTKKGMEPANGKFEAADDKAISDIQLGMRGDELFVKSGAFSNLKDAYTYIVTSDYTEDEEENEDGEEKEIKKVIIKKNKGGKVKTKSWYVDKDVEVVDIKKVDGKKQIIINGKIVSPENSTIDIKKENGKDVIIVNGKRINPDDEETEIEIEKDGKMSTYVYAISSDSEEEEEEEDTKVKIVKSHESRITFGTSNGNKKPLFIVDGKEVTADKFKDFNPNKIESISVLKDKAATELYGKKGENGVIIVTTKKKK